MTQFLRFTALSLCIMFGVTAVNEAVAQANLPEFTVLEIGDLDLNTQRTGEKSYQEKIQNIDNEEMRAHLLLQNEITMLGALQSWQEQVSELEATYKTAGLPFTQPDPPRSICEQVPSNVICNNAYPDLAPKPKKDDPKTMANALAVQGIAGQTQTSAPAQPAMLANNYEWASISCLANDCRAVLLDKNQNIRFSVMNGENIDDGITITDITAMGVTVRENDKTIKLKSSVQNNNDAMVSENPLSTTDQLTSQLSGLPNKSLSNVEPVVPIVIDDGSSEPAAPLGATGLF